MVQIKMCQGVGYFQKWGGIKGTLERYQHNQRVASAGGTKGQDVTPGLNERWSSGARRRKPVPEWHPSRKQGGNTWVSISSSPKLSYQCLESASTGA